MVRGQLESYEQGNLIEEKDIPKPHKTKAPYAEQGLGRETQNSVYERQRASDSPHF